LLTQHTGFMTHVPEFTHGRLGNTVRPLCSSYTHDDLIMLSTLAHECLCCIAVLLLFDWIALYQATESCKVDAKRSDEAAQGAIFTHAQTCSDIYTHSNSHACSNSNSPAYSNSNSLECMCLTRQQDLQLTCLLVHR